MSARPSAASWNCVTKRAPKRLALSAPSLPFERFAMKIRRLSMIKRASIPLRTWPRIFRKGDDRSSTPSKEIKADGMTQISRVEINHVIRAPTWDLAQHFHSQITVRIDQADTLARFNVLQDQVAKERTFARAGLPNDIRMVASVRT